MNLKEYALPFIYFMVKSFTPKCTKVENNNNDDGKTNRKTEVKTTRGLVLTASI